MKKIAILSMLMLVMVSTSSAQDSCITRPSCVDMGYTKTESECEGKNTLKCPFDLTAVSCENGDNTNIDVTDIILETFRYKNIISGRLLNVFRRTSCEFNEDDDNITTSTYRVLFDLCAYLSNVNKLDSMNLTCLKKGDTFTVTDHFGNCGKGDDRTVSYIPLEPLRSKDECSDGDFYFDDDTCFPIALSDKNILGIVIDADSRLVINITTEYDPYYDWVGDDNDYYSINNVTIVADESYDQDFNGKANTAAIIDDANNSENTYPLAQACAEMTLGNKEWYLPAEGEIRKLNEKSGFLSLFTHLNILNTTNKVYISSSTQAEGDYNIHTVSCSPGCASSDCDYLTCKTTIKHKGNASSRLFCTFKY